MVQPKVLILISRRYNPRELWGALKVLQQANIAMDLCSTGLVVQNEENPKEAFTLSMTVDVLKSRTSKDYSGVMVISGNPKDTEVYYKDVHVQRLIKELNQDNKPIAGICAAVPSIAPAVKGKKVSWFPLMKSREILTRAGAILTEVGLTLDQNVITAENEWMTKPWSEAFRDMVLGKEPVIPVLVPSGHRPKQIPRRKNPILEALRGPNTSE